MARDGKTTTTTTRKPPTAAKRKPAAQPARRTPAPAPADKRDELSVAALARGILAKDLRPRASDVRRLAEAVLGGTKPKKDKKGKKAKDKKLARIPGQRAKK